MSRLTLILISILITACGANTNVVSPTNDLLHSQVHEITVLNRYAITPSMEFQFAHTPQMLRPTDNDILTTKVDLNDDGLKDVIGTIDNYKFKDHGKYPLFIILKDEYNYHQLQKPIYIERFSLKVLNTSTNGFKDISVDGKILKYDGNKYD